MKTEVKDLNSFQNGAALNGQKKPQSIDTTKIKNFFQSLVQSINTNFKLSQQITLNNVNFSDLNDVLENLAKWFNACINLQSYHTLNYDNKINQLSNVIGDALKKIFNDENWNVYEMSKELLTIFKSQKENDESIFKKPDTNTFTQVWGSYSLQYYLKTQSSVYFICCKNLSTFKAKIFDTSLLIDKSSSDINNIFQFLPIKFNSNWKYAGITFLQDLKNW